LSHERASQVTEDLHHRAENGIAATSDRNRGPRPVVVAQRARCRRSLAERYTAEGLLSAAAASTAV